MFLACARSVLAVLLAASLAACGGGASEPSEDADETQAGGPTSIRGTVMETARPAARVLVEAEDGRVWSVPVGALPPLRFPDGPPVAAGDLLPGMPVEAWGEARGDTFRPDSMRLTAAPAVLLAQPRERMALTRPVVPIEGHALRGREVRYRLLHGEDVLEEGALRVEAIGVRRYGTFRAEVALGGRGRLERPLALEVWADGDQEPVRRALRIASQRTLVLYFPSHSADPERTRCRVVYPVHRPADVLASPEEVARLLIGGLGAEHERRGFYSALAAFEDVLSVELRGETAVVELPAPTHPLNACDAEAAEAQLRYTFRETFGTRFVRVRADGRPLVEE